MHLKNIYVTELYLHMGISYDMTSRIKYIILKYTYNLYNPCNSATSL